VFININVRFDDKIKKLLVEVTPDLPPPPPSMVQKAEASIKYSDIVAATLIGEAGGEGYKGMQAVMNVIMNRVKGGDPFRGAVNVVLKPKQFSFFDGYNAGSQKMQDIISKAMKHPRWAEAKELAFVGMRGKLEDITDGATHYHVTKGPSKATPYWSSPQFGGKNREALATNTIGSHTFFKNIR
jgi:spore germination cell wall hydrolase CwlJ-like protein